MSSQQIFQLDIVRLRNHVRKGLPGHQAHRKFSPELSYGRHQGPISSNAHAAAVIVALCETENGLCIPLTLRSDQLVDHRGQVSLPGGRLEPYESSWHAAVREFHEELGAEQDEIELISPLTSIYVYASNHDVQPYLAIYHSTKPFIPNREEVSKLLMLPCKDLIEENAQVVGTMQRGLCLYDAPGFNVNGQFVWGATAMILGEVAELLR